MLRTLNTECLYILPCQACNEIRWRPGHEASLAVPRWQQVFQKQMCYIEESICDIIGTFWRPSQSLESPA